MSQIFQIDSQEALSKFFQRVDGLHDALLREAAIIHPGYVDDQCLMFYDFALPTVKLLLQSQDSEVGSFELRFFEVSIFRFDPRCEFRAEGEIDRGEVALYPCGKARGADCQIRGGRAEYELLGKSFLGPVRKLVEND